MEPTITEATAVGPPTAGVAPTTTELNAAARQAERRKTILEEVMLNQQASQAEYMINAGNVSAISAAASNEVVEAAAAVGLAARATHNDFEDLLQNTSAKEEQFFEAMECLEEEQKREISDADAIEHSESKDNNNNVQHSSHVIEGSYNSDNNKETDGDSSN